MLYVLAHFIQKHIKPLWAVAEGVNACLFKLRYGGRLQRLPDVISAYPDVSWVKKEDAGDLAAFFSDQPEEAFEYFKPHKFDEKTLARLAKNPSMLMYVVKDADEIVGYFFLRCFFMGKSYLGKMVDVNHQGKGIGQIMCCCAMDIASSLGVKMFESISKDNPASLLSTQKVLETRVIKELDNGYLYIQDLRKK